MSESEQPIPPVDPWPELRKLVEDEIRAMGLRDPFLGAKLL